MKFTIDKHYPIQPQLQTLNEKLLQELVKVKDKLTIETEPAAPKTTKREGKG